MTTGKPDKSAMSYITDLLYLLAAPIFLPPYLYKILVKKKYRESTKGMLGLNLPRETWNKEPGTRNLWLHAVSVGEVVAGKAVLAEWVKLEPGTRILASTVTETGQQKAREILTEAEAVIYYPLDFTGIVRRFLATYNPQVYIMMETEIWPNFLREAGARGVKIFLANGKLSDRSFSWWMKAGKLFQGTFDAITAACVQTQEDREKFMALLRRPEHILVTGNCKFDSSGSPLTPQEKAEILSRLKITDRSPILVVGSTHPGEEEIILEAWDRARQKVPGLKLILAPRHPERFDAVARLLESRGIVFSRYSNPSLENPDAVLVDAMGVLAKLYGVGDVAVVAGSFVPIGGHNLLEAAVHRVPVLYGPHMHKQPEILKIFKFSSAGKQVEKDELAPALEALFLNEDERRRMGEAGAAAALQNRGSARRTVEFIRSFTEKK